MLHDERSAFDLTYLGERGAERRERREPWREMETLDAKRERLAGGFRYFFWEAHLLIIEVLAPCILATCAHQLARFADVLTGNPAFSTMASRMDEQSWALCTAAVALLPVVAFVFNSTGLRWMALVAEFFLFTVIALDTFAGRPHGLFWIFPWYLALGCALGSFRLAPLALRPAILRVEAAKRQLEIRWKAVWYRRRQNGD